jgi:AcrR family transcriptional regulator
MSSRERRTQLERSTATRRALLSAAVDALTKTGYSKTSTTAVHELAGVSRGGMLHHFRSKLELTLATLDYLLDEQNSRLRRAAERIDETDETRIGTAVDVVWKEARSANSFAALEHWTAARTDPELRNQLSRRERAARPEVSEAFAKLFGEDVEDHPAFEDAVDMTIQYMRGAALTYGVRRNAKRQAELLDRWKDLLGTMLNSSGPA